MGLVRIVIQKPEGQPLAGLSVSLAPKEAKVQTTAQQSKTDQEGVVRFSVEPGTYAVQFDQLPAEVQAPKYGTTVRLDDFAEGMEQIIRLVKVG